MFLNLVLLPEQTQTTLAQVKLHRDDLVLVKEWHTSEGGITPSGLWTADLDLFLPAVYADVILAPSSDSCPVRPGDFVLFARYAGEEAFIEGRTYHFLHVDDIEAVIELDVPNPIFDE